MNFILVTEILLLNLPYPLQVPLSILIIWAYAFFLTAGGAYNYKGCSPDIPSSNIVVDACRKHAYTMKHCRTDVSNAWRTAAWVRIPYPLQWGVPIFHLRTSIIMIIVSLVVSVDSVSILSSFLVLHFWPSVFFRLLFWQYKVLSCSRSYVMGASN